MSFVDCIKAYCKAKDVFGWTEKSAADATASTAARMPASSSTTKSTTGAASATDDVTTGADENDEMLSMPINTKVVTSTDLYVHICMCIRYNNIPPTYKIGYHVIHQYIHVLMLTYMCIGYCVML